MKLYILIHEQDTDSTWGATATPFIDRTAAQNAMRQDYAETIQTWGFDETRQTEEHRSYCHDGEALVRDDTDVEHWRIEEHELQVEVAVKVHRGLVQAIYANADIDPDVYDLDVSDFAEDGETAEADIKAAELERLKQQPGWKAVY